MSDIPVEIGPYDVEQALGKGGMGLVLLARHRELGRRAAVKVLTGDYRKDPQLLRRFHREAEAATRLSHPCLVKVYDFGDVDGVYWFAMEYVPGRDLAAILRTDGPLRPSMVLQIVKELLSALEVVHRADMVHRDLKPSNVMIDEGGRARILDLGLVKALDDTVITMAGSRIGSPRYMAPEMVRTGVSDGRSDLYQVALIARECLTGVAAFEDPEVRQCLQKVLDLPPEPVTWPADVQGTRLVPFIECMLAKDPDARLQSASRALRFLDAEPDSDHGESAESPRIGAVRPGRRSQKRPRVEGRRLSWMVIVAASPLVLFAVLGAISLVKRAPWRQRTAPVTARPSGVPGPATTSPSGGIAPRPERSSGGRSLVGPVKVEHGQTGWVARWSSEALGPGRVEVRSVGTSEWTTHGEGTASRTEHRVAFTQWPSAGGRLEFRVAVGASPPSAAALLDSPTGTAVDAVQVRNAPGRIDIDWCTAHAAPAVLSLEPTGLTTADSRVTQHHHVTFGDVAQGQSVAIRSGSTGTDGSILWKGTTDTIVLATQDAFGALVQGMGSVKALRVALQGAGAKRASTDPQVRRAMRDLEGWTDAPSTRTVLERFEGCRQRIFSSGTVPSDLLNDFTRVVHELIQVESLAREFLGKSTHLPVETLNFAAPRLTRPPGLTVCLALRLDGGGIKDGRTPATVEVPWIAGEGPAFFQAELRAFTSAALGRPGRFEMYLPLPPCNQDIEEAWLGARTAGGHPTESLVVRCGSVQNQRGGRELVFIPGSPEQPREKWYPIDHRTLRDSNLQLRIHHEARKIPGFGQGITLDHLILAVRARPPLLK